MNKTKRLRGKLGFLLCSALLACTTYGQPSASVGVSVGLPSVEIRANSDFYEPLASQGEWVVIGSYGRCWRPGHVDRDWRPYSEGYWQRTDAGWYWVSDEPWGWATYHYGRWNYTGQYGWYWVPQTQWAPSWVSWHSGGGYIGWAPLYPSGVRVISPRAYVFVQERHFMDPVHRSALVANNSTIIKKTMINKGPATAVIEKASGRKIRTVQVQELRHKEETAVFNKQQTPTATSEKKVQTPVLSEVELRGKKTGAAYERPQVEKPAVVAHESVAPISKNHETLSDEARKSVSAIAESKPEARAESNHPAAIRKPTGQQVDKHFENQKKPAASEKNEPNTVDKDHEDKGKE